MRIAICDDEPLALARLEELAVRWSAGRPCRISAYSSGEELLFETAGSYPFDLMLLDIEMGRTGGIQLARMIRETDKNVPIAFLTNHSGYVFEGYEVSALRYLLKPVTAEKLFPLLDLALERAEREPSYLALPVEGEIRRVDQDAILYLEARGHMVFLQTTAGPLTVKTGLSALSRQLGGQFAPSHRSYLVNLRFVERVGRTECLLENGESVPVSRGAWEGLNRAFLDYYRET